MQKEPCASNGSTSLANFNGFEECEPRDDDAENDADGDGICESDEIAGCQDATACNYNENATDDDSSCVFAYCVTPLAPVYRTQVICKR